MDISAYGLELFIVGCLLALSFIVFCYESGGFRNIWAAWKGMGWGAGMGMAALCAVCTVVAQKPENVNGGDSNASSRAVSLPLNGVGGNLSGQSHASSQQPQQGVASVPQDDGAGTTGPQGAPPSGPSRIVLQSTLATDPRAALAFSGEPGWAAPAAAPAAVPVTPKLAVLSFADVGGMGCPSPVRFPGMTNIAVSTVLLVARGEAVDLATLIDGQEIARLRVMPAGCPEWSPVTGLERALTEAVVTRWWWEVSGQWNVLEIDFGAPADLGWLFFGGTAGRPAWLRNWRGEIAELAAFNAPPDADTRAGVANYFSIRWGFGGYPATSAQRVAAMAAGLDYGIVWGTALIIK